MTRFKRADVELYTSDFRFFSETLYLRNHPNFRTPLPPGNIGDVKTTAAVVAALFGESAVPNVLKPEYEREGDIAMEPAFADLVENLEKRGFKKGFKRGFKRGIIIGKREVALQLNADHYPFDFIVRAVKLDAKVVRAWFRENDEA